MQLKLLDKWQHDMVKVGWNGPGSRGICGSAENVVGRERLEG